jgi:hypothetical protein
MAEWTERAALLFKPEGLNKLQNAKVIPSFDEDIVEDSMSNDEETNNE